MRYACWAIAVFFAFVLQGKLSVFGFSPDLTVLPAYYAGISYGRTKGLLTGALIGLLEDGISSSILGPNILSKGIIGYSASFFISGGIFRWTPVLGIIAVFIITFADNLIVFISRSVFDAMPAAVSSALLISVMQSLLNSPAGIFIRPKDAE